MKDNTMPPAMQATTTTSVLGRQRTPGHAKSEKSTDQRENPTIGIIAARILLSITICLCYAQYDTLQGHVNDLWDFLCGTWVFNSVYFETWWATLCYALILAVPFGIDHIKYFDKYKIDARLKWRSAGMKVISLEAVEYCLPLMLLDTFTVKKYCGVDPKGWRLRGQHIIQTTRALPAEPPTVFQIIYQLLLSLIIYDLMFFVIHFTLHRNFWLYKYVHASHHEHDVVHSRVTNQLTVAERIVLVLSANQALKILGSHPLTRTLFVPVFICMLVENHCGYDLPFTPNKIVPFQLLGGSPQHYKHHAHGNRNYQPFFTYIDRAMAAWGKYRKCKGE